MQRSAPTASSAADSAATCGLEPDADADAGFLRTERLRQITAMVTRHDAQLHRVVRRRGSRHPEVVADACTYAWIQLLAAEHVDLRPPLWEALAWLTSCAVRYAWMLDEVERHVSATDAPGLRMPRIEPLLSGH